MGNWGEITTISGVMGPYGRSPPCRHRELFQDAFLQGPNMETDLQYMYQTRKNGSLKKDLGRHNTFAIFAHFGEQISLRTTEPPKKRGGDGDLFALHIFLHRQLCYFQFSKYLSWRKALFKGYIRILLMVPHKNAPKSEQNLVNGGINSQLQLSSTGWIINCGYEFKNLLAA